MTPETPGANRMRPNPSKAVDAVDGVCDLLLTNLFFVSDVHVPVPSPSFVRPRQGSRVPNVEVTERRTD